MRSNRLSTHQTHQTHLVASLPRSGRHTGTETFSTKRFGMAIGLAAGLALVALGSGCATRTVYVREGDPAPYGNDTYQGGNNNYNDDYDGNRAAPPAPARPRGAAPNAFNNPPDIGNVSADSEFYDALAPYGRWYSHARFGYVFVPSTRYAGRNFRPYSQGHWEYTEWGWTFVSHQPYGWATAHYGRWFYDTRLGWAWVPGTEWAPAWVSWRDGGGYVGWAPIPPGGVSGGSYDTYQTSWIFVSTGNFGAPLISSVLIVGAAYNACYGRTRPERGTVTVRGRRYYRGPNPGAARRGGARVTQRPIADIDHEHPVSRPPSGVTVRRRGGSSGGAHAGSAGRARGRDRDGDHASGNGRGRGHDRDDDRASGNGRGRGHDRDDAHGVRRNGAAANGHGVGRDDRAVSPEHGVLRNGANGADRGVRQDPNAIPGTRLPPEHGVLRNGANGADRGVRQDPNAIPGTRTPPEHGVLRNGANRGGSAGSNVDRYHDNSGARGHTPGDDRFSDDDRGSNGRGRDGRSRDELNSASEGTTSPSARPGQGALPPGTRRTPHGVRRNGANANDPNVGRNGNARGRHSAPPREAERPDNSPQRPYSDDISPGGVPSQGPSHGGRARSLPTHRVMPSNPGVRRGPITHRKPSVSPAGRSRRATPSPAHTDHKRADHKRDDKKKKSKDDKRKKKSSARSRSSR